MIFLTPLLLAAAPGDVVAELRITLAAALPPDT